ncbi:MAG: glycosyltransferase family 4 protein [Terracidiphilus sp.]
MRVLLSAYACEPGKGSEPEVGWQRALHMLALADEVWVLTRANNQAVIEADPLSRSPGLHFIYYDLPQWVLKLKKQTRFLHLYFILWQVGAYRLAARLHCEKPFDRVYHVTFVSMQSGSFMGRLGIPFIIGPIAGGERSPFRLRHSMPFSGKARELLRDLGILFQRCSPLTRQAFAAAEHIFVTTSESLWLVPPKWRYKTEVQLAIATHGIAAANEMRRPPRTPRFVFAGHLIHLKGVHLAIRALGHVKTSLPEATLTLIGSGPAEGWLRSVAMRYGVAHAVEFVGQIPRQKLVDSLGSYTALVFPSLHDTGGMVVLEAFSQGLPVICFDLGGPGVLVNESCGIVVSAKDADESRTVAGLADAMVAMATRTDSEMEGLSRGARERAREISWASLTARAVRQEIK